MKLGISVKIDVTKIDKNRLFKGAKGTYLDMTTFVDLGEPDQYGNHGFISQSVTKDERDAGVQTEILGNVKVFYNEIESNQALKAGNSHAPAQAAPDDGFIEDSIPF